MLKECSGKGHNLKQAKENDNLQIYTKDTVQSTYTVLEGVINMGAIFDHPACFN